MATYFETIRVSVLWFPLLALLLVVPLWIKQRIRFGELHEYRAAILMAFSFYLLVASLMTVLPLPQDSAAFCALHNSVARTQLVPFASFLDVATYTQVHQLSWWPADLVRNMALWQILLNCILLLPFGLLLRALYGLRFVTILWVAVAFSLFLELTQLTGVWGLADCPYRLFDVDDLLTNSLGALLGWGLLPLFSWLPDPQLPEDSLWYRKKRTKNQPPPDQ